LEKPQVDEFMFVLEGQTLKSGRDDKWLWRDIMLDTTLDIMLCLEGIARQDFYKAKLD